ncbi:MAG: extracellular solute-binding protein [Rhodospirillales bacterium]|tara:strand:- start:3309 stop:4505 length:1197 start_codon:yes stop_codon:yes gene_type:complete
MGRKPQQETSVSAGTVARETARLARTFTRRTLLSNGAALAAGGIGMAVAPMLIRPANAKGETVNVLTWTGYIPARFAKTFKKKTGITANITTVGSNEEMLSQVTATHGRAWDVISPSAHRKSQWLALNMTQAWDMKKIPNLANVQPAFLKISEDWSWDKGQHHLPHIWGTEGIAWRTDRFMGVYGKLSLADLWLPEMKGLVQGRAHSLMSGIGRMLAEQGKLPPLQDAYKDEGAMRATWNDILKFAIKHKPWLRAFWHDHESQKTNFTRNGVMIGQTWDGPAIELAKVGQPIAYMAPKEGAFAWMDGLSLTAATKNSDAAHAFVDALYTAQAGAQMSNASGYNSVVQGVESLLTKKAHKAFKDAYPGDALEKLWWWPDEPVWFAGLRNAYRDRYLAAK